MYAEWTYIGECALTSSVCLQEPYPHQGRHGGKDGGPGDDQDPTFAH